MWVIFALLTSMISAFYTLCNQNSRLKAEVFIVYRGLFVALAATPLALAYFHIFPWQFYAIAVFQGLCISYLDYKYFQICQKFGAENVKGLWPLTVFIVFVFWLLLEPDTIVIYIEAPVRSFIIIASMMLMIYAMTKSRNSKIGKVFLKEVLPLLCLSSIIDISNKSIMAYNDGYLLPLTFHRVAITGFIIGGINLLLNSKKIGLYKELIKPKNILGGSFVVLIVLMMIFVNLAMHYTPNPAYVSAISLLSVVWIVAFNKIRNLFGVKIIYQSIGLKWILLLLFSAVILIFATQN